MQKHVRLLDSERWDRCFFRCSLFLFPNNWRWNWDIDYFLYFVFSLLVRQVLGHQTWTVLGSQRRRAMMCCWNNASLVSLKKVDSSPSYRCTFDASALMVSHVTVAVVAISSQRSATLSCRKRYLRLFRSSRHWEYWRGRNKSKRSPTQRTTMGTTNIYLSFFSS